MTKTTQPFRCWAEIEREAVRHNARLAKERVGTGVDLLAVIKANGYGHGLTEVAQALRDEAQLFGVANLKEALEARRVVPHPVMILGPALPEERAAIVEHGFIPSISNYAEAQEFNRAASSATVLVNCVIDTGMGRMGLAESEACAEVMRIASLPQLKLHSVSTHLPSADEELVYTREQLARFDVLVKKLRREVAGDYRVHVLLSAGVAQYAEAAHEMVRAGLMLYGASGDAEFQKLLRPVLTWKTRVVLLRDAAAGSSISYGRTFVAPRALRVATLSAGYADGLPRALSNRGAAVLIGGQRCPVLGRVTMDLTLVDVSGVPSVAGGDEGVLLGRQGTEEILATEMAERAGTIAWEIFTGIGSRVPRVYL
ncbi:MAG: alanine racemase [Chthoniobacterales bacterium]